MAARVIFFSDTHLGFDFPTRSNTRDARASSSMHPQRRRRGPDFFANVQRVLDYARESRADLVIHGGDVFNRSQPHPYIVDLAYQMLCEFAESGIPLIIVPGNHERSVLPPSLFLNHPGIHVFDRPRTYLFELAGCRLAVSGFPYLPKVRRGFAEALRESEAGRHIADQSLLCVHHAVDGAIVGPGDFMFQGREDVIDSTALPANFDAVLSGHIHRHQILNTQVPVVYCGSIERTSFAERDEAKGFCELLVAPKQRVGVRFHELPTRPMIDFTCGDGDHRSVGELARRARGWHPDTIVRIRFNDQPGAELTQCLARVLPGSMNYELSWPRSGTQLKSSPSARRTSPRAIRRSR